MHRRNRVLFLVWLLVVTGMGSLLSYTKVNSAQQSPPPIQITFPQDGTVVAPGEIINVIVTPGPNITFTHVAIIGGGPIGFSFIEVKTAPPFVIPVTIPNDISPGRYLLTASGVTRPGKGAESRPITINVERPDSPTQLRADPKSLTLRLPEMPMPLHIQGTFSDGTTLTLNESTLTTYSSSDTSVATVDNQGFVRAVGEGTATITVTHRDKSLKVPVKVEFERQSITIDILPGSSTNRINLDSQGDITVAILTTQFFDPTRVDPLSVRFGPNGAMETHGRGHFEDVDGDGFSDMVLHFHQPETGIQCLQKTATLTGSTFDGVLIRGVDSIRPRGDNCIEIPHK